MTLGNQMLEEFKDQSDRTPEDLLKSILDSTFNGIMAFQSVRSKSGEIIDFEWIFVNEIAEKIVGISKESLIGARLLEVMPGNKDAGLFQRYVKVVESGVADSFEQFYPSEEINKWFKIQAVPLHDGFTVTFQDITEAKGALITSQVNEKRYKQLFDESLDAIFQIDEALTFTEVSPSFEKLFGYPKEQLKAMQLEQLFTHPAHFQSFKRTLNESSIVEEYETELSDHAGYNKICIVNCVKLSTQEKDQEQYLGVIRDLSKRKKVELELIRAEKLSMTGKLARTIAHEVRNPLTNLTLALDQLKDEVPNEVEDAELYFNIIQRNAERIGKHISDLLDSSKPKTLELVKTPLRLVVDEAAQLVGDRLKLQEMKMELSLPDSLPEIMVDAAQLKIALLNLFINAIEAMTQQTGVLSIEAYTKSDWAIIQINDNGKGLSPEQQKNIFEPFFSDKKDGTGLGLITVQNIIHSHGGKIEVESEVGIGTRFAISLPIR